jgi:TolA-binding protein
MSSYKETMFLSEFKSFLDERVDCRLEAMLTEDDRTANHEDRTAELESKIEELESKIEELESLSEYYFNHEDRICELEDEGAKIGRSQLLKDLTAIVDRSVNELMTSGRIRLSIQTSPPVE